MTQIRLTEKLLRFIYSALDKSPDSFVAFRAQHSSGGFSFNIVNYVLDCYVNDSLILTANLGDHTIESLAGLIGKQDGMSIVYRSDSEVMGLSARVIMDGFGKQSESNGDCFYGYSSLLWVYLESVGKELSVAEASVVAMLEQMNLKNAEGYWLDYWGEHYGVIRVAGELDAPYAKRIIVEILRPRGNNKAIEAAFRERFGQNATVADAPQTKAAVNTYNGSYQHTGAPHYYDGTATVFYGLFDVVVAYDLEGNTSPNAFATEVRAFVENFRDAGTQLQSLNLSSGSLNDTYSLTASDAHALSLIASLADTFTGPSEDMVLGTIPMATLNDTAPGCTEEPMATVTTSTTYNSQRNFNGLVLFQSGTGLSESWS